MSKRVLVTGGAGFAGFHICEGLLHSTDWEVIVLDRLTYSGTLERLRDTFRDFPTRISFVYHDFRAAFPSPVLHKLEGIDYVIHNGGETHVERSLQDPLPFVEANVLGTTHVLNACRVLGAAHVIYVSTDEVHGPAPNGVSFKEDAPIRPSNPYSGSKAGGEAIAFAYGHSMGLPVTITRTMNLVGEKQHPEKFVPMCIRRIQRGETVTIHGINQRLIAGGHHVVIGSRKWLHARNQADALLFLLEWERRAERHQQMMPLAISRSLAGETFHIAGEEHTNLEIAQIIAETLGKPLQYEIVDIHSTRKGHDLRYSLDDSKLRSLGWSPPVPFRESLERTVQWTIAPEHTMWLQE